MYARAKAALYILWRCFPPASMRRKMKMSNVNPHRLEPP